MALGVAVVGGAARLGGEMRYQGCVGWFSALAEREIASASRPKVEITNSGDGWWSALKARGRQWF